MIKLKTEKEIETLREGGKRLASIIKELSFLVLPENNTKQIEEKSKELFDSSGGEPAFFGYQPKGVKRAFPARVCVSVNDVIVHGIPNESPIFFEEGDLVTIDGGLKYGGLITDMAITFGVGEISSRNKKLLEATKRALDLGIKSARPGGFVGDIGHSIEEYVRGEGFSLAEGLAGHGVGFEVHEDPFIPNTGSKGEGDELISGLVIAIEPMLIDSPSGDVKFSSDDYTISSFDGSMSAHFEHTVAITDSGPLVLTRE